MKRHALPAALALLMAAAPVFADGQNENAETPAPAAESVQTAQPNGGAPAVRDRYERYNRFMFKVNDKADRYVLAPVARGYRKVTPAPVRGGVRNFFNNLRDVVSFGSNVLRLDAKRASEDFMRVAVNTTFGLGGLINIADAGGIPDNKNTLGDTFASWGWKNSHYFVYPITGPSTLRDSVGNTALMAYPVKNAIFHTTAGRVSSTALQAVNTREEYLDLTDSIGDAALDPYIMVRDGYMQMRDKQIGNTAAAGSAEDIDIDELVAPDTAPPASGATAPTASDPAELSASQPYADEDTAGQQEP